MPTDPTIAFHDKSGAGKPAGVDYNKWTFNARVGCYEMWQECRDRDGKPSPEGDLILRCPPGVVPPVLNKLFTELGGELLSLSHSFCDPATHEMDNDKLLQALRIRLEAVDRADLANLLREFEARFQTESEGTLQAGPLAGAYCDQMRKLQAITGSLKTLLSERGGGGAGVSPSESHS